MRKELVKMEGRGVKMPLIPHSTGGQQEPMERLLGPPSPVRTAAGVAVAVVGPVLVTAIASAAGHREAAVPALLYLLAVVGAAAVGHLWSGLLASALSFIGLDYFFTPPVHTFVVSKTDDLIALAVFLLVSAVVSAAISATLAQRAMAEFREHQVRALYHVSSRLLSGSGLDAVLLDLATSLRGLYGLRGCRVAVLGAGGDERTAVSGSMDAGPVASLPLESHGRPIGRIEMAGAPARGIGGPEGEVLSAFAGQLALALEQARLGERANEARLEAEASRTRAALFSSVTHDLRTPLASITASASSLLEEGVPFTDYEREDLLRTILEESARLNRLVANLMDLSRIRAGALVPSVELVPVEELVSAVVQRLRPQLGGRHVRVTVREDVPPVPVDVVQMDQVFTNLLENAIRYTPPGTEVGISAVRWEHMVEIRVSDRGPGIPAGEREKVFAEFYRKDVGAGRGGTGLGLAIAQAVVVAHGGSIRIEDTPGGGATVVFRLPLGRAGASPAPVPGVASAVEAGA